MEPEGVVGRPRTSSLARRFALPSAAVTVGMLLTLALRLRRLAFRLPRPGESLQVPVSAWVVAGPTVASSVWPVEVNEGVFPSASFFVEPNRCRLPEPVLEVSSRGDLDMLLTAEVGKRAEKGTEASAPTKASFFF